MVHAENIEATENTPPKKVLKREPLQKPAVRHTDTVPRSRDKQDINNVRPLHPAEHRPEPSVRRIQNPNNSHTNTPGAGLSDTSDRASQAAPNVSINAAPVITSTNTKNIDSNSAVLTTIPQKIRSGTNTITTTTINNKKYDEEDDEDEDDEEDEEDEDEVDDLEEDNKSAAINVENKSDDSSKTLRKSGTPILPRTAKTKPTYPNKEYHSATQFLNGYWCSRNGKHRYKYIQVDTEQMDVHPVDNPSSLLRQYAFFSRKDSTIRIDMNDGYMYLGIKDKYTLTTEQQGSDLLRCDSTGKLLSK